MKGATSNAGTAVPQILVLGSLNIDLVTTTTRIPNGGETLTARSFATYPGGKGANQAVACARASGAALAGRNEDGLQRDQAERVGISMAGAVGNDSYADLLLEALRQNGVKSDCVSRLNTTTGVAVIIVEENGENRILITPGANGFMTQDQLPSLTGRHKPDLLVMQLEIPLQTVLHALEQAKKEGIDVLLNPAPAVKLPDQALAGLAHLVLNETEAATICDLKLPTSSEDLDDFLTATFNILSSKRIQHVIITLGAQGVAFCPAPSAQGRIFGRIDAEQVANVVDTTAAGDTFVGYYACAFVETKQREALDSSSLAEIIARANRAAARAVTREGAMGSIPFRGEL